MSISQRTKAVKPSATLAISAKAQQKKANGIDVISLSAGEPDFATPENICQAGIQAISQNMHHYTPVPGKVELRAAIAKKLIRDNNLEYSSDEIIVSNGAKQSIFNAIAAIINPGDEVIIPCPYWVSYPDMVKLNDGTPVLSQPISGLKPTAESIEQCITAKTKLLILNSPNNPAGYSIAANELKRIGDMLNKYPEIIILSDDIYEYLNWTGNDFVNIANTNPELSERIILINGASKGYAMTGWRIGYTACKNNDINKAMKTYQSQTTSCPSAISQHAFITALETNKADLSYMLQKYQQRHDIMLAALLAIPGVKAEKSEGAFYSFPNFEGYIQKLGLKDDLELADFLLEKALVAIVPGSAFGMHNYLRMSFATSEENIKNALARIHAQVQ